MIVPKFTCPVCNKVRSKIHLEKYHGENCKMAVKKKVRSKAPGAVIDINKYTELHEELISVVGEYYNHHIAFINKPSKWVLRDIVSDLLRINRTVKKLKENNLVNKQLMAAEYAERKKKLAEKKLRKKNGTNNNSIN